jgi:phosphatidylglycerol:prolipoprotein diacylglycerol transferase
MRLVLLHIDSLGLVVRSHSVMMVLALLVPIVVGPWWAESIDRIPKRTTLRALVPLIVGAIVGGHLHYATNYPMLAEGRVPWNQMHASGAILGVLVAAPFAFLYASIHPGRMADALMPVSGIAIFLARVGCFLNGCCYGTRCSYPWCIPFPPNASAAQRHAQSKLIDYGSWSLPVHPLQLYFAGVGLVITIVALWLIPRRAYRGQVALVSLLIFSLGAYWLEPLRENLMNFRPYWGSEPQLEVMARLLVAISVGALLTCEIGSRLLWRRAAPRSVAS